MRSVLEPDLRIRESGSGKTMVKGLGTRIVIGCPNVNEQSILLKGKDPVLEETGEYIFFKAGWSVWNVLQNIPIEYVHSTVNETRLLNPHLFAETNDAILPANMDRAISRRIGDPAHGDTGPATILSVELDQPAEIKFKERVAVHNHKLRS